ncbi:zonular occludens toxin domain-containing protein [Paenibacillus polymyxa]|uniref:AAA family ATPase n=1 Tax=Paenibacillus polymyxa TaxID=1406 RepID=UPI002AB34E4A|nr:zonular occludens toxin domain-containing protein [Paenibacillus polymyxa]MDY8049655.1 zonular occludens toxin domain-containing protein [Paenibacillus polymyxa]
MGIDGTMGTGKTLCMSVLAQHFRQQSGCTLYSNYGLKNSKLITNFEMFLDVAQQPSSIICLDEAHIDLDSRSVNTNVAKYLTHMLFFLRKLRCTLMFTSPDITNIDIRVRLVMNVYCRAKKNKTNFTYSMWNAQDNKPLKSFKVNKNKIFSIGHEIYDTNKMVIPMDFPQTKEGYIDILNLLKKVSDDYYGQAAGGSEPQAPAAAAAIWR